MRKLYKLLMFFPLSIGCAPLLSSCGASENVRVLRVLNCEDYIYEYEEGDEENATEGENWYKEDMMDQFVDYWAKTHDGEVIEYVYDTFDTNETMFNELQTGKTTYDVIVPSDYMIQKLISKDMLHKISDKNKVSVWENISPYLIDKFNSITAVSESDGASYSISDFSVPYMWGTVGMMYNPEYYIEESGGALNEEQVHELFMDWDSLYTNEYIKGTYSIKDSVRDTYAVSLIHAYRDEIASLTEEQIANGVLGDIFNRHSESEMAFIKDDMLKLKDAAFGFECDSGKTDMVDGKVGANMCWSGDATWAIAEASDGESPKDLYYAIPTSYNMHELQGASNIWFDGLCIPKNPYADSMSEEELNAQYDLAEEFIKFMSTPEIAAQNCYCVGYTPGVAGEAMFDYMLDSYDISKDLKEGDEFVKYNLTYFYKDTLSEDYLNELGLDNDHIYIYADPATAKKELAAQYPEQSILSRLAVMKDFGKKGNEDLLNMWEQVRTNSLPLWAIIVFSVEGAAAIAFGLYLIMHKVYRKRDKKLRHN